MRMGLLLLSLALLAASAQASRAAPDTAKPPAREKLPANLRGALAPDAPTAARPRNLTALPGSSGPSASAPKPPVLAAAAPAIVKPTETECRASCAHDYYFCLSGSANIGCSDTWSQCLSTCSYPSPGLEP